MNLHNGPYMDLVDCEDRAPGSVGAGPGKMDWMAGLERHATKFGGEFEGALS
jgi:hypothetical protein